MATILLVLNETTHFYDLVPGATTAPAGVGVPIVTNAFGTLDASFFNQGQTAVSSTGIQPGNLVNLYNNAGVLTARLADANSGGFTAQAFAAGTGNTGQPFQVQYSGTFQYIDGHGEFSSSSIGLEVYLSTVDLGGITLTEPSLPNIQQSVGYVVGYNSGTQTVTVFFLAALASPGVIPISQGGTGAITAAAALISLIGGSPNPADVLTWSGSAWHPAPVTVIDGVTVSGSAATGQVITATSPTAAHWASPAVTAPGSPSTAVQFNNAGAFGGNAALTWDFPNTFNPPSSAPTPALIVGPAGTNESSYQSRLIVNERFTTIAPASFSNQTNSLDLEMTGDQSALIWANIDTTLVTRNTAHYGSMYCVDVNFSHQGSGMLDYVNGVYATLSSNPGSPIGVMVPVWGTCVAQGPATSVLGALFNAQFTDNSTLPTLGGVDISLSNNLGTVTTAFGLRVEGLGNIGTIGTYYGIYVGNITGTITNPYGVYVATGAGKSQFNSDLQTTTNLIVSGALVDGSASPGTSGQVLSSTVTGVAWVSAPPASAGGSPTQLQYNLGGALAGITGSAVSVAGGVTLNVDAAVGSAFNVFGQSSLDMSTATAGGTTLTLTGDNFASPILQLNTAAPLEVFRVASTGNTTVAPSGLVGTYNLAALSTVSDGTIDAFNVFDNTLSSTVPVFKVVGSNGNSYAPVVAGRGSIPSVDAQVFVTTAAVDDSWAPTSVWNNIENVLTITPTVSPSSNNWSGSTTSLSAAGTQAFNGSIAGQNIFVSGSSTGLINDLQGLDLSVQESGSGGATTVTGLTCAVAALSSVVTLIAGQFLVANNTPAVTNVATAVDVQAPGFISGSTVAHAYGLHIADQETPLVAGNTDPWAIKVDGGVSSFTGVATKISTKTTTYTVTRNDYTINCNGTFTVTLPTTGLKDGQLFQIKNIGTGTITIACAVNIDGTTSILLTSQYESITVQWDATANQFWIY